MLLTLLIILPLLGALLLAFVPADQKGAQRGIGAAVSLLVFFVSIPLVTGFDSSVSGFQPEFTAQAEWITSMGASWQLGLDGISLWIVMLTTFLTPLILISAHKAITKRVREFIIAMLVLESAMIGTLLATDLLLFYLFWEMMLIPMYLLIGIWGGSNRHYATIKFVIYTVVGSLLMLVGIIYLYLKTGESGQATFSYDAILALADSLTETEQTWLFLSFALAFLIKVPLFPFHTWLPDAHTEAPTAGSVILAGVLLKMGTYGLLRFALPLFPEAMGTFSPAILILSVFGIAYGAMVAFAQSDVKKLVAYSSVSHLGFVMLGIVALNQQAVEGSILQMINHGISTGALFLLVGIIYERRHTRDIKQFGGIARSMPVFTTMFVIVTMSAIGLPGTNGFAGEFMILSGAFLDAVPIIPQEGFDNTWPILATIAASVAVLGVLLGAIYMLSMVRRVFFGPITRAENEDLKDMTLREHLVVAPLIVLIFFIGLWPTTLTSTMSESVRPLVTDVRAQVRAVRDAPRVEWERKRTADAADTADTKKTAAELAATITAGEK